MIKNVSEAEVEQWLVDHSSDGNKYPDALTKLTDLKNETWSSGGEGMPTMQELRNDIHEKLEERYGYR